jgi:hypothetical protein
MITSERDLEWRTGDTCFSIILAKHLPHFEVYKATCFGDIYFLTLKSQYLDRPGLLVGK